MTMRMTLPDDTLAATVERMRAERETVAAERTAEGLRQAAAIRADADRDARKVVAEAREQAARTEADALIINPAAYSFTSIAMFDAMKIFEGPIYEVHISNIHARDELHRHSKLSAAVKGVIAGLGNGDRQGDRVQEYAGLWSKRPALALLMTVFLLSLGGFPPLGGFIAKWYVFSAAIAAGNTWLAIIGVLTSVVSVFFYLRVVVMMYMADDVAMSPITRPTAMSLFALAVPAIAIFYLGILPTRIMDLAIESIATIL